MNFYQIWIPDLIGLETLWCWRHLILRQLCLRGLHCVRSLRHCSTCQDTNESTDFIQRLRGRSNCSFLELIWVHIQPRLLELSFLSSSVYLCHMAAALGSELLIPSCRWRLCLLPWQSSRGSSGSSNVSWKKCNRRLATVSRFATTQLFSSCIARCRQTNYSSRLCY